MAGQNDEFRRSIACKCFPLWYKVPHLKATFMFDNHSSQDNHIAPI